MRAPVVMFCAALAACSGEAVVEPPPQLHPPVNLQWADVGQPCSPGAPAVPLGDAARDSLPTIPGFATSDDRMADIARRVPGGWGGNARLDGVFTVYLVDTTARAAASTALAAEGYSVPPTAVVRRGRWDFAQLHDWYRHLLVGIDGTGITMSDIQEAENRIHLFVRNESARAVLAAHLRSRGAVCNLVAIGVSAPVIAR